MGKRMLAGGVLLLAAALGAGAPPGTGPAPGVRAARSVHLGYATAPATAFHNEVTVRQSAPGSYFMVCGFSHGYFGMQQPSAVDGKKVILFSVWDPTTGNQAASVPADQRVEVLYQGADVTVKRFGGEGTGGQSFFNYDWKVGTAYQFLVTAQVAEKKTAYAAYFYVPEAKAWKHLATLRTTTGGETLKGLYSFIEDFRRDGKSATEERRAEFGHGWVRDGAGKWQALTQARFTASSATWEAAGSIDAGVVGSAFYLQTGGNTVPATKLDAIVTRPAGQGKPPEMPAE